MFRSFCSHPESVLPHPAVFLYSSVTIIILIIELILRCPLSTSCRLFHLYALPCILPDQLRPCETHTKEMRTPNKGHPMIKIQYSYHPKKQT